MQKKINCWFCNIAIHLGADLISFGIGLNQLDKRSETIETEQSKLILNNVNRKGEINDELY